MNVSIPSVDLKNPQTWSKKAHYPLKKFSYSNRNRSSNCLKTRIHPLRTGVLNIQKGAVATTIARWINTPTRRSLNSAKSSQESHWHTPLSPSALHIVTLTHKLSIIVIERAVKFIENYATKLPIAGGWDGGDTTDKWWWGRWYLNQKSTSHPLKARCINEFRCHPSSVSMNAPKS